MTQNQQVLKHLKSGKSLTPIQALRKWGVMRLAARIDNLRVLHDITTTIIKKNGKRFASYSMEIS